MNVRWRMMRLALFTMPTLDGSPALDGPPFERREQELVDREGDRADDQDAHQDNILLENVTGVKDHKAHPDRAGDHLDCDKRAPAKTHSEAQSGDDVGQRARDEHIGNEANAT